MKLLEMFDARQALQAGIKTLSNSIGCEHIRDRSTGEAGGKPTSEDTTTIDAGHTRAAARA